MKHIWTKRRGIIARITVAVSICFNSFVLHAENSALFLPIVNAGFELPALGDGSFTSNIIPGWNGTDTNAIWNFGVYNPPIGYFPRQAPEGFNVAYIERGAIYQILSSELAMDTDYRLSVFVGDSLVDPLPGFAIQLRAGGEVLAETTGPSPLNGDFQLITLNYHVSANNHLIGKNIEVWLIENAFDKSSEAYFDNIVLEAVSPVPESKIYAMLLVGLGLIGFRVVYRKDV
ncbi:MAG: hypothetical protein R3E36_01795 [Nitrosomonas sp.]|nr:hypothetical protein [Nitrosomonas sp.]MCP5252361.1 hypothetical protein [Burkholderiales bacterium]MDR4519334.1 hypothetical protein [Nitrosomonas sp.]